MNFFKKLFSKKKLDVNFYNTDSTNFTTYFLYSNTNSTVKDEVITLTGVITIKSSFIKDYLILNNLNSISSICKEKEDEFDIFIYGTVEEYIETIKLLNPYNIFFKAILDLMSNLNILDVKELLEDKIITKNLTTTTLQAIPDYELVKFILSTTKNITFKELSHIIRLNYINRDYKKVNKSLYEYVNEYYNKFGSNYDQNNEIKALHNKLVSLYTEELLKTLICIPKYKSANIITEDIENEIFETIGEFEEVITEDEDGNLIYDKNNFE